MKFPLADWIDSHPAVRHNLAQSGMVGAIHRPILSPQERRSTDPEELRSELAGVIGVASDRLFLTHGATEANAWATLYVGRSLGPRVGICRVRFPEYPPLYDGARAAGFEVTSDDRPADLAIVSQPRNPEGDEWPEERLLEWASGSRHLLVDETFREFGERRSLATGPHERLWVTGSFTKFFAGDDLRVGFVVVPSEEEEAFARFIGLFANGIPAASVAGALSAIRHRTRIHRDVDRLLTANRRALARAFPGGSPPVAPVWFDRTGPRSADLARRLLAASVLVCPGSYFGDPGGNRICLTRRTFPTDLGAYLAVRGPEPPAPVRVASGTARSARPRPGETGPGRAGRA